MPLVFYRWDGTQPAAAAAAPAAAAAKPGDVRRPEDFPPAAASPDRVKWTGAPLVWQRCFKCHQGAAPAGGLDLSGQAGGLDQATRLKAIARLLEDDPERRMPKGVEIDADERGRLIQHFAKESQKESQP